MSEPREWNYRENHVDETMLPRSPGIRAQRRWLGRRCWAVSRHGFVCSRAASHSGRHASYALGRVIAVWP